MINIRNSCFETNSSSMHSFIISKKNCGPYTEEEILKNLYLHNGRLRLWNSELEFDRSPFRILTSFKDKLCFLIAEFCGYNDDADNCFENEIMPIIKKVCPSITSVKFDKQYEEVYEDSNGNKYAAHECALSDYDDETGSYKRVYIQPDETEIPLTLCENEEAERNYYGYAESFGLLSSNLQKRNISIEEFLLNREYMIVIDGDEYNEFGNLLDSCIIHRDEFIL